MVKNILFPTDFSESAENAFLFALAIAQKFGAKLNIIHVFELPELGRSLKTTTKEVYEMMEMEALEDFKKSVKKLRKIASDNNMEDVEFSSDLVEGETVYTITKIAEKEKHDLIVMGTQGSTGLAEIFLGSVASGVIDESKVPVLTVPNKADYEIKIQKIAYLSNYKPEETTAFNITADYAEALGAELLCVHYDGEEENINADRDSWKNSANQKPIDISYHVITGENFEKSLVNFNQEQKINMLAIQPRKRNIFARLFSKSVSKTIAHHIKVPLLTLPKL